MRQKYAVCSDVCVCVPQNVCVIYLISTYLFFCFPASSRPTVHARRRRRGSSTQHDPCLWPLPPVLMVVASVLLYL